MMIQSASSNSSNSSWVVPFLLGSAASFSAVWISQNWTNLSRLGTSSTRRKNVVGRSVDTSTNDSSAIMDAPDLDQRMLRKCEAVLQWRTSRLVLVIERCTNDHNYSAILRTAEALGIQTVFMVDPPAISTEDGVDEFGNLAVAQDNNNKTKNNNNKTKQGQPQITRTPEELEQRRLHHLFAQNATEWLEVRDFETSEACVAELRKLGYHLWVTDLSQEAEALPMTTTTTADSIRMPDKIALVMGTEAVGASQYILNEANKRVYLPLRGFADSLNLSVATALIIHHMFCLDPSLIGAMDEEERAALRRSWYVKLVQQRLLSSSQKKTRTHLQSKLKKCESIFERTQKDPSYQLQPSEQKKLDNWTAMQNKLDEIDSLLEPAKVEAAIQEWLDHPPAALTDLRRADTHRVCFVGKNTKGMHKEHWKDMVATSNSSSIYGITAAPFREKVLKADAGDDKTRTLGKDSQPLVPKSVTTNSRFIEKHF